MYFLRRRNEHNLLDLLEKYLNVKPDVQIDFLTNSPHGEDHSGLLEILNEGSIDEQDGSYYHKLRNPANKILGGRQAN